MRRYEASTLNKLRLRRTICQKQEPGRWYRTKIVRTWWQQFRWLNIEWTQAPGESKGTDRADKGSAWYALWNRIWLTSSRKGQHSTRKRRRKALARTKDVPVASQERHNRHLLLHCAVFWDSKLVPGLFLKRRDAACGRNLCWMWKSWKWHH